MEFGVSHLIENPGTSLQNLKNEVSSLGEYKDEYLYEFIGDDYVRVNLRPYSKYKLNINSLNEFLIESANVFISKSISFDEQLITLKNFLLELGFKELDLTNFFNDYKKQGYPALNHSESYKREYQPSYRIIHKKFLTEEMKFYQVKHYLDNFNHKDMAFIAIDGKCTSGKTSISNLIQKEYDATIIHVDDFFDIDGTDIGINSDRLIDEVFNQIIVGKPFSYNKYNCKSNSYQTIHIEKVSPMIIFEGVYSANKKLFDKYHGVIYLDINEEEQIDRLTIRSRNLLNRFIDEWIPRENYYFQKYNIKFNADIIV